MIRKIRWRFIRIAMTVLSIAILALAAVINAANWMNVRGEIQETLSVLADSRGTASGSRMERRGRAGRIQNTVDESRYFTVSCFQEGNYVITDISRLQGQTDADLQEVILPALRSGQETGRSGNYQYLIQWTGSGRGTAVFLNCETKFEALRGLALLSAAACAGGILIAWLLVYLFSEKAIRPLIRNAEQQKRFITDAGHELKTPLAVISANMDAMEIETDRNEWIDSTREQLDRMKKLVSELTYLSRLDEEEMNLARDDLDFSALVREEVGAFQGMAEFQGKTLEAHIADGLCMIGDRDALRRLVSQLCDNALKYSPEGDLIRLTARPMGKSICLTAENSLSEPMSEETLSRLFDRFYRPDASRSRESGGSGIGLSMIRAVAEKHGGQVGAELTKEGRIRFTCTFPVR